MVIILITEIKLQESLYTDRVWEKTDEKSICTSWKLTIIGKKKKNQYILWLVFLHLKKKKELHVIISVKLYIHMEWLFFQNITVAFFQPSYSQHYHIHCTASRETKTNWRHFKESSLISRSYSCGTALFFVRHWVARSLRDQCLAQY